MLRTIITPKARQVFAASSTGMMLVGMMSSWGYPSAALPQMEQMDSGIHLTIEESSWFATVPLMMCIPGSVIGASLYELTGPRRTMLFLILLLCASFMAMALAELSEIQTKGVAEVLLLSCRVVQGSVIALLNPFASVYIYEISGRNLRGALTSMVEIWASTGFLLCYISGCFLSWSTIALLLPAISLIPAFLGILFSPESPLWLARKGKEVEAKEILTIVRCKDEDSDVELKAVLNTLEEKKSNLFDSLSSLAKKSYIKPMLVSCSLLLMKELGGFATLSIYVVQIFDEAGVGLDPKWSSVVVGAARLMCNCLSTFLLHRLPRRWMLVVGNILTGIATFGIGVFFYLQSLGQDVSWISWLPLTGFILHMIGYATGVGPCTWTASVEVLPGAVRSIGFGIGTTCYAIAAFGISKAFLDLQLSIGLHGIFWIFSTGSIMYIIIALFVLPETKGLTLQDIEDYWGCQTKADSTILV